MLNLIKKANWFVIIFTVINSIILAALIDFSPEVKLNWKLHKTVDVTYQDLAATLMTGVSVLVTVLGVIVAIITFVGFRHIKIAAVSKAVDHVKAELSENGGKEAELRVTIKTLARKVAETEAAQTAETVAFRFYEGISTPKEWGNKNSEYGD